MKAFSDTHETVAICGAGPIGLLLANLLGHRGVKVIVLEKRLTRPTASMAIGITPPSLKILKGLDLVDAFLARGVPVQDASVFEKGRQVGDLSFASLNDDYPFILSLPQTQTIEILERHLERYEHVRCQRGMRVDEVHQHPDHVTLRVLDTVRARRHTLAVRYLVGCDGVDSHIRGQAGIQVRRRKYNPKFLMADFDDQSGYGDRACLFFAPNGSVESFPLPGRRRRWIVQLDGLSEAMLRQPDLVERVVQQRCHVSLSRDSRRFHSHFGVHRMLARHYYRERVILCGDAAHAMSPVGGQGMNTGFADAALLAETLFKILRRKQSSAPLLREYERSRKQACRAAACRAACNMWVGTRRGPVWSRLRYLLLRALLQRSDSFRLAEHFAMLTLPNQPIASLTV
jgi:2-polyprenyl-6-methoxyphenol hydroxylase-like FAD-dependent oxidoreductase